MIQWNNTAANNLPAGQPQMTVTGGRRDMMITGGCDCPACRLQRLISWLLVIALVLMIISLVKKLNA